MRLTLGFPVQAPTPFFEVAMSCKKGFRSLPAPCLVDAGTLINPEDIRRVLGELARVRYFHFLDQQIQSQGVGWLLEVFCHPQQSTIVANNVLYINVCSFDYLKVQRLGTTQTQFDLVQDGRVLRLVPLEQSETDGRDLLTEEESAHLQRSLLDSWATQGLSARWDSYEDGDA